MAQLVWVMLTHRPKGCGFNPQSGQIPGLWVWSLVRACMRSNQPMFLALIFLSLFLSPLSFLPSSLWKQWKHVLQWGLKRKKKRKKTYLKTRKCILHIESKIGVQYKNNSSKQKRTFNFFKCYFLQNELCLNTFAFTVLDKECRQTNRKCRHQDFC